MQRSMCANMRITWTRAWTLRWYVGWAQVWDFLTGKLKRDLQFQADEQFMMHDTAVLALAFSRDSELLASASQDGKIKVPLACSAAAMAPLPPSCSSRRLAIARSGGFESS